MSINQIGKKLLLKLLVAALLLSDYCDYIVGATLFVDGGMTLFPGFAENG